VKRRASAAEIERAREWAERTLPTSRGRSDHLARVVLELLNTNALLQSYLDAPPADNYSGEQIDALKAIEAFVRGQPNG
jgi:hypothetical protein